MNENYYNWLMINTHLKEISCKKYTNAIKTVSDEMIKLGIINKRIENCQNIIEYKALLEKILECSEFLEKDKRGNRMYSMSLRYYLQYLGNEIGGLNL